MSGDLPAVQPPCGVIRSRLAAVPPSAGAARDGGVSHGQPRNRMRVAGRFSSLCLLAFLAAGEAAVSGAEADTATPPPQQNNERAPSAAYSHEPDCRTVQGHAATGNAAQEERPEEKMREYKDAYHAPVRVVFRGDTGAYLDIVMLLAALGSGLFLTLRGMATRALVVQLIACLAYFGFVRGGCVCPIGAMSNALAALTTPEVLGLTMLVFLVAPLAVALVAGRVFCGTVCPLGAWQQLVWRLGKPLRLPQWAHRLIRLCPLAMTAAVVWSAWKKDEPLICRADPFVPSFRAARSGLQSLANRLANRLANGFDEPGWVFAGDATTWLVFGVTLLICFFIALPFCRFVCPYGVLLGIFSLVASRRRSVDQDRCVQCGACAKVCPTGAIGPDKGHAFQVSMAACVQCGRCTGCCPTAAISCPKAR